MLEWVDALEWMIMCFLKGQVYDVFSRVIKMLSYGIIIFLLIQNIF